MFSYLYDILDKYRKKRTEEDITNKNIIALCDKILFAYTHRGIHNISFTYTFTDEELEYNNSGNYFINKVIDKISNAIPNVDVLYIRGQKLLLLLPKEL